MSKSPLISVVLPVYNCSLYIEEAINSILNQTIQDFEIIIIDDCSVDDTVKIVLNIPDERIRLILKEQNVGLIDSLNIGFKEAKGKYIARMDGDDISFPDRFQKQLEILENNPEIKACGCWLQSFGAYEKTIKHLKTNAEIRSHLLISNPMSLGATMLKREAYKSFQFSASKVHVEDYDFWARTAWKCPMYNIQEILYSYRVHEGQVSQKYKQIQREGDIQIKLFLFKKLNYNLIKFDDLLITKILYTNEDFSLKEFKLIYEWFKELIQNNSKMNIFDNLQFKNVVFQIQKKIVFDIYFTNNRKGINKKKRIAFFKYLPLNLKLNLIRSKIKERVRIILK